MSQVVSVPASDWASWVSANGAVILDVREPAEWELGTLPGSKLISLNDLVGRIDELDAGTPVLCVCRSGARSGMVAAHLIASGFETVANLAGGVKALGMQD